LLAQNGFYAETIRNAVVEKNRWDLTYGNPNAGGGMSINLGLQGQSLTARNNIFDTKGVPGTWAWPINVLNWNPHLPSDGIDIYNNTINTDSANNNFTSEFSGVNIGAGQRNVTVKNNLIIRPSASGTAVGVKDEGVNTIQSNNLYIDSADFVDENGDPRNRNYMLNPGSPALNSGDNSVPVLDDFDGVFRNSSGLGNIDIGAYEQ